MEQSSSQNSCTGSCPQTLMAQANQNCTAVTQSDGNLVIYNSSGQPVWSSGTANMGTAPYSTVMQSDGNYVLYDANNTPLWSSGTNGQGTAPYNVVIQNDCSLVILDGNNNQIWSSATSAGIISGGAAGNQTNPVNRDLNASVCKATPNGLNTLGSEIDNCTSNSELNRNYNFAQKTLNLQTDIQYASSTVQDTMMMGDTMFGQYGYDDLAKQVRARNTELKSKKDKLLKEVEKDEAVIERSNRDFSDVKDTVPQPQPKRLVRFIEDYTVAFLILSYLFMIICIMYIYISMSENKLVAFGKILIVSIFVSMFLFMILYYLT
jgi:hypothetical protein